MLENLLGNVFSSSKTGPNHIYMFTYLDLFLYFHPPVCAFETLTCRRSQMDGQGLGEGLDVVVAAVVVVSQAVQFFNLR